MGTVWEGGFLFSATLMKIVKAAFAEKLIPARALAVLTLHHISRDVFSRGRGQFPKTNNGRRDVVRQARPTKRKKGRDLPVISGFSAWLSP
jgi:hypothetical protein